MEKIAAVREEKITKLDALGPRIALCEANREHELTCLPLLVLVSLHIAADWLKSIGEADLIQHAYKLRNQGERPWDFRGARSATSRAYHATHRAKSVIHQAASQACITAECVAGSALRATPRYAVLSAVLAAATFTRFDVDGRNALEKHVQRDSIKVLGTFEQMMRIWE